MIGTIHAVGARRGAARFVLATALACAGGENGSFQDPDSPAMRPDTSAPGGGDQRAAVSFSTSRRVLYRISGGDSTPILALDSAAAPAGVPVMPKTYRPIPESEFGVQGDYFRFAVPSPDARWIAVEPFSTHDLLAVVPATGGQPKILDFYYDSGADSLVWAPGGRYLASHYTSPAGFAELRLYDAQRGIRLTTPWAPTCTPQRECAVTSFEWTGPTSLTATTTVARRSGQQYRVDASQLTPYSRS